jgi:type IV secretion system protein VirD4
MPQIHGTAQWSRAGHDLSACFRRDWNTNGLIMGLNNPGDTTGLYWNTSHYQGHGLCFAPNRMGKGASIIMPALLNYAGSTFVLDPKGEAAWVTAPRRREMGQRVVMLDPFNEVTKQYGDKVGVVEKPTKFNPLAMLDPLEMSYPEDIATLTEALAVQEPHDKAHFVNAARDFIAGTISLCVEKWGDQATFKEVRTLLTGELAVLKAFFEELRAFNPESYAVGKLSRFLSVDNEEVQGVVATAITQTQFLDSRELMASLVDDAEPFSFDDFVTKPTTVYVVLPPHLLRQQARWLRLMLVLVLRSITRSRVRPEHPHMLLIDEMGTIGPLLPLEQAFGQLAGYAVRFMGFFQTLGQLKKDYPSVWNNFVGNCSFLQLLGATDLETAKFFSELLGTTTITSMGKKSIDQFGNFTHEAERQDGMPLMTAQQIMSELGKSPDRLWLNKQIVIARTDGAANYKLLQNPYFARREWAGWFRPIPWLPAFDFNNLPAAQRSGATAGGNGNTGGGAQTFQGTTGGASVVNSIPRPLLIAMLICIAVWVGESNLPFWPVHWLYGIGEIAWGGFVICAILTGFLGGWRYGKGLRRFPTSLAVTTGVLFALGYEAAQTGFGGSSRSLMGQIHRFTGFAWEACLLFLVVAVVSMIGNKSKA